MRSDLNHAFFERENIIDGILTCFIARQHVLLLGPPGTGKSAIASSAGGAISSTQYFQWLLTKFTTPEELFGPYSINGLKQDKFQRKIDGYLPTAHIAFLDEIFKANSSILNALLTLINERLFYNDSAVVPCPLITVIGASNELPEGAELDALYDRFILRYWVGYLSNPQNLRSLLTSALPKIKASLALGELETMQKEAEELPVPDSVIEALITIKAKLAEEKIIVSDRRWKQIVSMLRAYAYVQGDNSVSNDHLDILGDCLWDKPQDRTQIQTVLASVGNPLAAKAIEILDEATKLTGNLPGLPSSTDTQAKTAWITEATQADGQLQQMDAELEQMLLTGGGNLRKVQDVRSKIADLRANLTADIGKLYGLGGK